MTLDLDFVALPLVLGGNVFGWTADEPTSFALLDAYVEAGGSMVDTADVYSQWAPGHVGGESERVIGAWLAGPGKGSGLQVATKVAKHAELRGLAPTNVRRALERSLERLGLDRVELYYAHEDDPSVPMDDIVGGFAALVAEGRVGAVGLSNFTADRIQAWVEAAQRLGVPAPAVYQGQYNLMDRSEHEEELLPTLRQHSIQALPYYGLARGFLTGKYRDDGPEIVGPRAAGARAYLDDRGRRVLAVLDRISTDHGTSLAAVALAWLATRPGVAAPIASARSLEQLGDLLAVRELAPDAPSALTADELTALDEASASA